MTDAGDSLRAHAEEVLAAWPAEGLAEGEWSQALKTGAALFARFQRRGSRGDPIDLEQAHRLASLGYQRAPAGFRQEFTVLLVSVLLVRGRYDSDPRRRATVASMTRQLCRSYLEAGDKSSLQTVTEIARLWERCATIAGASAEAAEAEAMAASAARASGL
ncbi:MAG TPA: hypothetical protein VKS82_20080 [Streptosporangiaceae bacterium]|nr:hypothetical protein [Streptosporangiaceae bacterium]